MTDRSADCARMLRKIEALFAGADTVGEKLAAGRRSSASAPAWPNWSVSDKPIEMQFSLPDQWSRQLFLALCRRYGLKPYRLNRQRVTTVMLRVPKRFVDQVLWPEFQELNTALMQYLNEVTTRVIRKKSTATPVRRPKPRRRYQLAEPTPAPGMAELTKRAVLAGCVPNDISVASI